MPGTNVERVHQSSAPTIPIYSKADVVIAGGGTAGLCAAIAAARCGAKTLLIERWQYLGGSLTGTYASQPGYFFDSNGKQVIGGIGWELAKRMERMGAAILTPGIWWAEFFPEAVKSVALDMVLEAGVEVLLHTWICETLMDYDRISALVVVNKSGRQAIEGTTFVDATGDADLAFLSGAPYEKLDSERLWQTSVDLTVCNVDAEKIVTWAKAHPERIKGWVQYPANISASGIQASFSLIIDDDQSIENQNHSGVMHQGPMPTVKLMIHPSVSRVQGSVEIDGTDAQQVTYAEIEARRRALAHLDFLRRNIPGYENAIVVGESPLGVRETRRIVGEYVLKLDDLLSQARFPDVVALNCRALDRHLQGEVFRLEFIEGNHDIPYRALIPQKIENLLVAGRCISSDHEANASLRGAATCMATGHAAGVAAALATSVEGKVRKVNVEVLQELLRKQGAILDTVSDIQ